jgi:hypothetical protein
MLSYKEAVRMQISIAVIKINTISNIGSLNIGKTILSQNTASLGAVLSPFPGADGLADNEESEKRK